MKINLFRAILYGIILWLIGFIWGSIVFMTPGLREISPIPYVSSNPAISFPILILWLIITPIIVKRCLKLVQNKTVEGVRLGVIFSVINILLDLIVLVVLLKAGFGYFASLTVWLGYIILLMIPIFVGKSPTK